MQIMKIIQIICLFQLLQVYSTLLRLQWFQMMLSHLLRKLRLLSTTQIQIYRLIDMKWIQFPPKQLGWAGTWTSALCGTSKADNPIRRSPGDSRIRTHAWAQGFWSGVYARHGGFCWQHLQEWFVHAFHVDVCQFFQCGILKASRMQRKILVHEYCEYPRSSRA